MKKISLVVAVLLVSLLAFNSCESNAEKQARREYNEMKSEQFTKDGERQNPHLYIDVAGEIVSSDKIFSSKSIIRGQIRSKAKYTTYTSAKIKASFYSENDILIGSEYIDFNETISANYKTFEKKVKLPKGVSTFKLQVVSANAVQ